MKWGLPNRDALGEAHAVTAYDPLFRDEVIEARKSRLEGEIILAQPIRAYALTLLLVVIVALLAVWLAVGNYTRSEVARGLLVTDRPSAKIIAIHPGQIAELLVGDGEIVRAGQRLAVIRIEQNNADGGSAVAESIVALEAQNSLANLQADLAGRRAAADRARLSATLAGIRDQATNVAIQVDLQRQVVASARETFERIAPVMEKGFVSRFDYERRRQAFLAAQQQLAQLSQQANALAAEDRRTRAELERVDADAGTEIANAQTTAQLIAQRKAEAIAQRAYVITAPIDGRVTAVQSAVGRTVDRSASLMTVIPESSALHAELYAPSRAIGFVKPGHEVRLLYDAFPYQRFGSFSGRVTRVSRIALDPREIAAPLKLEEPVYRIEVALDHQTVEAFGEPLMLQPGMTLSANLILDRRSFWDWLLQPLKAVLKRTAQ